MEMEPVRSARGRWAREWDLVAADSVAAWARVVAWARALAKVKVKARAVAWVRVVVCAKAAAWAAVRAEAWDSAPRSPPTARPTDETTVGPHMKLAIASGKGGTGKTTVATNLASTIAGRGRTVAYVDCDTEAPNGHLFLHPRIEDTVAVERRVPQIDPDLCQHCGACAELCRFNAVLCLPARTVIYDELCHSCGGCTLVCPEGAIREVSRPMGQVSRGTAGPVRFVSGTLDVGVANSPPVVRAAKRAAPEAEWTILDAPPGTSCPMIETVRDCDYLVLVTEPTPFGLHDLRLAIAVARSLGRPCGVVVNRARPEAGEARTLCAEEGVPLLAEIPEDIAIARAYARGRLAVECVDGLPALFENLYRTLETACGAPAACGPKGRQ